MGEIHITVGEQGQANLNTNMDQLSLLRVLNALQQKILAPQQQQKPKIVPATMVPRMNGMDGR